MLLSAGGLRTKGFEILAIGGMGIRGRGNESQASQAGLWQLGGGILGFTGFLLAAWQLAFASACGGGVLRLQTAATPLGTPHAQRKGIWKLNGVREVMTMAMATGSEDDGGGHDSSDDVGQW